MDEIGEYHAKWNKPIPKNQRLNIFSGKWMMIQNRGCGWEKNGWTLDHYVHYVHVWLYEWYESASCTTIEIKICTPFLCNELKCSLWRQKNFKNEDLVALSCQILWLKGYYLLFTYVLESCNSFTFYHVDIGNFFLCCQDIATHLPTLLLFGYVSIGRTDPRNRNEEGLDTVQTLPTEL